jgi:hypothetical protein
MRGRNIKASRDFVLIPESGLCVGPYPFPYVLEDLELSALEQVGK